MRVGDQRRNNLNSLPETALWWWRFLKDLVLFWIFLSHVFVYQWSCKNPIQYLSREGNLSSEVFHKQSQIERERERDRLCISIHHVIYLTVLISWLLLRSWTWIVFWWMLARLTLVFEGHSCHFEWISSSGGFWEGTDRKWEVYIYKKGCTCNVFSSSLS